MCATPSWRRLSASGVRWVRFATLSVIGAVAFELILPIAWIYWARWQLPYGMAFTQAAVCLTCAILFYVVLEPIRIRGPQWSRTLWYPPLWLVAPTAIVIAAFSEQLRGALRPQRVAPDWVDTYPLGLAAFAFVAALVLRKARLDPAVCFRLLNG